LSVDHAAVEVEQRSCHCAASPSERTKPLMVLTGASIRS
jgi:hypothetical protein